MKSFFLTSVAGAGLLAFSFTATAQAPSRDQDSYHSDRDTRFHDIHWHSHLFSDVKQDVEHVEHVTWPEGRDEYRLHKTVDELDQLQGKMATHVYDERELDDVIGVLSRVVNDNRMEFRDRDMLTEDLNRLRDYRKHHADWQNEH